MIINNRKNIITEEYDEHIKDFGQYMNVPE